MSLPGRTRHLLTFSYIGPFFKASSKTSKDADLTTVIGSLELAFAKKSQKYGVKDPSPITISSRTDSRVHALQNTAHIDFTVLEQRYDAVSLRAGLNVYFHKRNIPLRISSIQQVSNDFSARKFARQRTYLYRIGVPKHDYRSIIDVDIPISEINRCGFLRTSNFNVDAAEEVFSLFPGVHNFCSFTRAPKRSLVNRNPIRRIDSCCIRPGKPLMKVLYEPSSDNFEYWDFIVEGRSFLYRQVRRMVSAAIGVAQGKCSVADVHRALESSTPIQLPGLLLAPAHGLYLAKVTYKEEDLLIYRTRVVHQEHSTLVGLLDQYKLSLET